MKDPELYAYLPKRLVNGLARQGIDTKDAVIKKFTQTDYFWVEFKHYKNLGVTSYNLLCDFAGFPEQKYSDERHYTFCPHCGSKKSRHSLK